MYSARDGALRYYNGVQLALSAAQMRAATQLQARGRARGRARVRRNPYPNPNPNP